MLTFSWPWSTCVLEVLPAYPHLQSRQLSALSLLWEEQFHCFPSRLMKLCCVLVMSFLSFHRMVNLVFYCLLTCIGSICPHFWGYNILKLKLPTNYHCSALYQIIVWSFSTSQNSLWSIFCFLHTPYSFLCSSRCSFWAVMRSVFCAFVSLLMGLHIWSCSNCYNCNKSILIFRVFWRTTYRWMLVV